MPVPTSPQDLIDLIREKLFNNTSGLIEEPDLREVLENIVKVLDAKFSMFSPNLTEEQYAQWNLILDYMLRETKGVLTTSSSAPTGNAAIGKYLLSGAGAFTNLGGLVTTADKLNYAYFDGTTWSKVEVAIQNGKSAYEVAVANGFVGTEAEWLESLDGTSATANIPPLATIANNTTLSSPSMFVDSENNIWQVQDGQTWVKGTDSLIEGIKVKKIGKDFKFSPSVEFAEDITKLDGALRSEVFWGNIGAGGNISLLAAKLTAKKDLKFKTFSIGLARKSGNTLITNTSENVELRIYKGVAPTTSNVDYSVGTLLGTATILGTEYVSKTPYGATAADVANFYNNDSEKELFVDFEFPNEISVVTGDVLTVVVTGADGAHFSGGSPSSNVKLYSYVLNATPTNDYFTYNEAWYAEGTTPANKYQSVLSYKFPFKISNKKTLSSFIDAKIPSVDNKTISEYRGAKHFIRNNIKSFYEKIRTKTTPVNLLFMGSSVTNLMSVDNGLGTGFDEDNLPIAMYNPNTYSSFLWRLFNKGVYNPDGSLISLTGNLTFIKISHPTLVTKTGTWDSNWNGTTYGKFAASGGSNKGRHHFHYTSGNGNYAEFTIPANSKGFAVVYDAFSGTRTDGTNAYGAADSVQVYVDNVLVDTFSQVGLQPYQDHQWKNYHVTPIASTRVVKIVNNSTNKWMNLWGVEAWKGQSVRPINTALNGGSTSTVNSYFTSVIGNQNPDLIIWESNVLNEMTTSISTVEASIESVMSKMAALNIPVVVILSHQTTRGANLPSLITSWLDYPNNTTIKYNYALTDLMKRKCLEYGFIFIDLPQYIKEVYHNSLEANTYTYDGTHLNQVGQDLYKVLLDEVFNTITK